MKTIFAIIIILTTFSLFAQNNTWFTNTTSEVGLDSTRGGYLFVVDLNNDEYPDIAMVNASFIKGHIHLYLNKQKEGSNDPSERYFEDITAWSGIDIRRNGDSNRIIDNVVFADVDNDGDVDAITGIYYHRWEYYNPDSLDPGDRCEVMLNRGNGKFDLLENSGLNIIGPYSGKNKGLVNVTGFSMLDYDLDGNIDVFIANWFGDYKNNVMTPSYMLKGNGDGTFADVSQSTKIKKNRFPLYGVNATDWNNDGYMDIATSPYCRSSGSLYKNTQNGSFLDVATLTGYNTQYLNGEGWGDQDMTFAKPLCTWATQPADFDNDGDMDFFFTLVHGGFNNDVFGNTCGRSTIVRNHGANNDFSLTWELERVKRSPPRSSHLGDYDACWLDFDNDMLLDLAMGNGGYSSNARLYFLHQDEDTVLNDISRLLDFAGYKTMIREISSLQPIDFDLDGDDDLLIAHGSNDHPPRNGIKLLENNIGDQNNWTAIKLKSPAKCNFSSIGSRITVYSGGVAQMREIKAGFGHFGGQQPFITNFGLAQNIKIDSIVVRWQTKPITYTKVVNPPINQHIVIDETGLWGTVAIEEKTDAFHIVLFPNPARNVLHLKFKNQNFNAAFYSIIDVSGKTIKNGILQMENNGRSSIDINGLQNGYYFINLKTENYQNKTLAFVISN